MFLHVGLGCFLGVMHGVKSVGPGSMCMVGRFLVMSALMVLGCFVVVTRSVRMVFCRLLMVFCCFLRHGRFLCWVFALGTALSREALGNAHIDETFLYDKGIVEAARGRVIYPS